MSKRKLDSELFSDTKRFSVPPPPLPSTATPPPGYAATNPVPPQWPNQSHATHWPTWPNHTPDGNTAYQNYNGKYNAAEFNAYNSYNAGNHVQQFRNNWPATRGGYNNRSEQNRGQFRGYGKNNRYNGWKQNKASSANSSNSPQNDDVNSNSNKGSSETYDDKNNNKPSVNRKPKRKSMSTKYSTKAWDLGAAIKAVQVEQEYSKLQKQQSLILKFPDPELNKDTVHKFDPRIEHVHFQQPSTARYCFVQLKPDADFEEVKKSLENVVFGLGKITVEKKKDREDETQVSPESIDPFTLYIGNLPTTISVAAVKEKYPTAARIDIGFAQRMKYTRYAFCRYENVDEAVQAYKDTHDLVIDNRSIIVRFRRQKGNVGLPGESKQNTAKVENPDKIVPKEPKKTQDATVEMQETILTSVQIKQELIDESYSPENNTPSISPSIPPVTIHRPIISTEIKKEISDNEINMSKENYELSTVKVKDEPQFDEESPEDDIFEDLDDDFDENDDFDDDEDDLCLQEDLDYVPEASPPPDKFTKISVKKPQNLMSSFMPDYVSSRKLLVPKKEVTQEVSKFDKILQEASEYL